jgi:hypothetical protein
MTGLNLSSVATFLESFILLDTVRISRPAPGQQVLNKETGQYSYPEAEIVYEGPGAVMAAGTPGGVTSLPALNLPWVDETRSRYRALTPLSAPIAERDMLVTVVQVHAGGDVELLGRQFRAQDPSVVGTISVVRITGLDQVQQTRETG